MSTVLAAIDNSAAAEPVVSAAKVMARLLDDDCIAFHVRENGEARAVAAAEAGGIELRRGNRPATESIIDAAQSPEVSTLVLGARASPAGRRPAGHTALAVVTALRKPVLVVPPGPRAPSERISRILLPLDGTMASAATLMDTIAFARKSNVAIVALHVHGDDSVPPFEEQAHHESDTWAREFVTRYCGCAPEDLQLEVRAGPPWRHVVEAAREFDVDVVVLGWRRSLEPGRAAVVREALGHSPVPVLLLPVSDRAATPFGRAQTPGWVGA